MHKIRFHIVEDGDFAVNEVHDLIVPGYHSADAGLVGVGFKQVEVSVRSFSHEYGSLIVGVGGVFEGGVSVADEGFVVFEWQHFAVVYLFLRKDGALSDGVVHVFLLEVALTDGLSDVVDFVECVVFLPGRLPFAV